MFDLSEEFGSNESASISGVWFELGDGAAVKVSRLGNPETQKAYKRIPRAIRRQMDEGTVENKQQIQFLSDLYRSTFFRTGEGLLIRVSPFQATHRSMARLS